MYSEIHFSCWGIYPHRCFQGLTSGYRSKISHVKEHRFNDKSEDRIPGRRESLSKYGKAGDEYVSLRSG